MLRSLKVTGIIAAGVTALAVVATPVMAANGPNNSNDGTCAYTGTAPAQPGMNGPGTTGSGQGFGRGNGMGNGQGNGQGSGLQGLLTAPSGTLTASQQATLAWNAQEEKLAHDVYVALAARYPDLVQFDRIANAETKHLTAVRTLLTRYGITDPTVGMAAGEFSTAAFQDQYDALVAGATTSEKALAAGIAVETADIAALTAAIADVTAPDALQLYTSLRTASQHHLAAFGG
jgi:hypothetical protein